MSSKKPHIKLGGRLKRLRNGWKLSQKDVAKRLKIATSTYQYYERGERDTPSEVLEKITTYGVESQWLLTGKGDMFLDTSTSTEPLTLDIEVLTKVIRGVEDYLQKGKKELKPDKKGRLVSLLYERFMKTGEEPDQKTIISYLKLVA